MQQLLAEEVREARVADAFIGLHPILAPEVGQRLPVRSGESARLANGNTVKYCTDRVNVSSTEAWLSNRWMALAPGIRIAQHAGRVDEEPRRQFFAGVEPDSPHVGVIVGGGSHLGVEPDPGTDAVLVDAEVGVGLQL